MIKTIILSTTLGLLAIFAIAQLALAAAEDFALYKAESACVMKHIANGVERRNITTSHGTCAIKGA